MKIILKPEVNAEIEYYVAKSNVEISGLGRCKLIDDNTIVVNKVYLLEQENGPTATDIDPDAVAKLMYESMSDEEEHGELNFWWHSHVNMGVFWSGTDTDTIKQFGENGYLIATVFNKKKEMRSAAYYKATDTMPVMFIDNIDTAITNPDFKLLESQWEIEFNTKAKTKVYTPVYQHKTKNQKKAEKKAAAAAGVTTQDDFNSMGWDDEGGWVPKDWSNYGNGDSYGNDFTNDTETEEDAAMDLIMRTFDTKEELAWFDLYQQHTLKSFQNITFLDLKKYCQRYDWSYEAAMSACVNSLAERDAGAGLTQ